MVNPVPCGRERELLQLLFALVAIHTACAFFAPINSFDCTRNVALSASQQPENCSPQFALRSLLEEAVLLYSSPSINKDTDDEIQQNIQSMRKNEVVQLIEDTALALDEFKGEFAVEESGLESLAELGKVLDDAIMNAIATNSFDNDVLLKIASTYLRQQKATEESAGVIQDIETRLKQQQVLIAPRPFRRLAIVVSSRIYEEAAETAYGDPVVEQIDRVAAQKGTEGSTVERDETVMEESKEALPLRSRSGEVNQNFERTAYQPYYAEPIHRGSREIEQQSRDDAGVEHEHPHMTDIIEAMNDLSNTKSDNEETASEESVAVKRQDTKAADAVAVLVSFGALAAAIVTKVPAFAAGVALGPAMSSAAQAIGQSMSMTKSKSDNAEKKHKSASKKKSNDRRKSTWRR